MALSAIKPCQNDFGGTPRKSKLVRYAHLGTGNYHAGNAKIYTDYGLLTTNQDLCEDVHRIFKN